MVQEVATAFPDAQVELWATDEHRIGLKPILRRVWAPIGQRPRAPVQHRYEWRYLVGFVHPASGRTLFHLATAVSIALFEAELRGRTSRPNFEAELRGRTGRLCAPDRSWPQEKARPGVGPGGVADQSPPARTSLRLRVPDHVYLPFLPAYSPELQPAEHLWPLTNDPLINRHFASIEDVEEAQAQHCVTLQAQPARVRSTTLFHWWPQRLHKRHVPRRC
jgi:hypothetical protein